MRDLAELAFDLVRQRVDSPQIVLADEREHTHIPKIMHRDPALLKHRQPPLPRRARRFAPP
jgi:hypothetical protein